MSKRRGSAGDKICDENKPLNNVDNVSEPDSKSTTPVSVCVPLPLPPPPPLPLPLLLPHTRVHTQANPLFRITGYSNRPTLSSTTPSEETQQAVQVSSSLKQQRLHTFYGRSRRSGSSSSPSEAQPQLNSPTRFRNEQSNVYGRSRWAPSSQTHPRYHRNEKMTMPAMPSYTQLASWWLLPWRMVAQSTTRLYSTAT